MGDYVKVSASTGMYMVSRTDKKYYNTLEEGIRRLHKAGYECADLFFCDAIYHFIPDVFLRNDNWMDETKRIKELGDELGIKFNQSHTPFYRALDPNNLEHDYNEEMIRRSIIASSICGVPWITMHSSRSFRSNSFDVSLHDNIEYFKPHVELAAKYGVGIAIENLQDTPEGRRFGATTDELLAIVDGLNDPKHVGVTWDVGHANVMKQNQVESLRKIGSRLHALHIHDNRGKYDEHNRPYEGTIIWDEIMKTLKEIKYDGEFTFEVLNLFSVPMPREIEDEAAALLLKMGNYMLTLAE